MVKRFWNWLTGKKAENKVEYIVNLGYGRNEKTGKMEHHGDWKDIFRIWRKSFINQFFKKSSKENSVVADRAEAEYEEIGKKVDFSRDENGHYKNNDIYLAKDMRKIDDAYKREAIIEELEEKREIAEDNKGYNRYAANMKNAIENDGFVVYESCLDEDGDKYYEEVKSEKITFIKVDDLTEDEKKVLDGKLDALDLEAAEDEEEDMFVAKEDEQNAMEEKKASNVHSERTSFNKESDENEKIVPFERHSYNPVKSKCMSI